MGGVVRRYYVLFCFRIMVFGFLGWMGWGGVRLFVWILGLIVYFVVLGGYMCRIGVWGLCMWGRSWGWFWGVGFVCLVVWFGV